MVLKNSAAISVFDRVIARARVYALRDIVSLIFLTGFSFGLAFSASTPSISRISDCLFFVASSDCEIP